MDIKITERYFLNSHALVHPSSLHLDLGWSQNVYIFKKTSHMILIQTPFLGVIFIVGYIIEEVVCYIT